MKINYKKIVAEEISNFLKKDCMLKEYKNPQDSETIRVCGETLKAIYDRITKNGTSKHEITMVMLNKIIGELKRLEQAMTL